MHPLLTFATGLLAGIAGVRALKGAKAPERLCSATAALGDKARLGLDSARSGLRDATVSGLTALEKTSAGLRSRLTEAPAEPAAEAEPAAAVAVAEAKPRRKPAARKPKAVKEAVVETPAAADEPTP